MAWFNVIDSKSGKAEPSRREVQEIIGFERRRAKPTFYVDENFPRIATALLRTLRARVLTAQELRFSGYPDEHHVAFALKRRTVLVSCDRDYLDERRFSLNQSPCIVVFAFGSGSPDEIWRAYRCLSSMLRLPQFFDRWTKIDANPDSWTEYRRYLNGTTSRVRYRWWSGRLQEWR